MSMGKSWVQKDRASREYLDGVVEFLNFTFARTRFDDMILCPCIKCGNRVLKNREEVHGDLLWNEIIEHYIHCTSHGEDMYGGHIRTSRALGKATPQMLSIDEWEQARLYIWNNCDEVATFVQKHKQIIKDRHSGHISAREVDHTHIKEFGGWFERHIDEELESLGLGPARAAIAVRNEANCSHRKMRHTGGTKSFACHRDEETRSRTDGSIPSRVDMYFRTHLGKDETAVDNISGEIISKFRELLALSSQDRSSSFVGDDIYTQVMDPERHGRVRGYGLVKIAIAILLMSSFQSLVLHNYGSLDPNESTKCTYEKERDVYDAARVSEIDRTMKRHVDTLLHALEGVSARLSQLESRTHHLESTVVI
ncbi:hypothetical protein HHK36_007135 [Tetracentron sinense]|uniref:Transposase-associated domain-containing protein n=1 Tax=Tetracentron sinense TaxID=13715 RepID=A0A834ZM36_TETSI|nr:hypothetical protein HHK36_007135 [Tetracentron sinense]